MIGGSIDAVSWGEVEDGLTNGVGRRDGGTYF